MRSMIRMAGALALAVACGAQAQNLSIATGGTGGSNYPLLRGHRAMRANANT